MKSYKMPKILSNQWCSLWDNHTLIEKMKRDGEINSLMTGGSIVHINVDSKLTPTQARKLITQSVENGMEHFALNCVYSECADCGVVNKGKLTTCPKCQSNRIRHWTRVIGYFSCVQNWGKVRREEDFPRRVITSKEDLIKELNA